MNFIDKFISWAQETAASIREAISDATDWLRELADRLFGEEEEALARIEEAEEEFRAAAERREEDLRRATEEIEREAEELQRAIEESREREEDLRRRLEELEQETEDLLLEIQEAAEEEAEILRQQLEELEEERREIRRELGEEIPEEEEPGPIDDSGLRRVFGPLVGEEEGPRWLERWAAREGVSVGELLWAIDHHSAAPAGTDFRGTFHLPGLLEYVRRLPPYVIPLVVVRFVGVGQWELWIEES